MKMYKVKFNEQEKVWSGLDFPPLYNTKVSVGRVILDTLERNPKKVLQVNDNNYISLTAEDIRLKSIRTAQNLQKLGCKTNDVIGIVARNTHHLTPIVLAAFYLGCPLSILEPHCKETDIVQRFGLTKPDIVFCDLNVFDTVKSSLNKLQNKYKIFTFEGQHDSSIGVEALFIDTFVEESFLPVNIDGETHPAVIYCSSGTTGPATKLCVSHATLLDDAATHVKMNEFDTTLSFCLLSWMTELCFFVAGFIYGAKRIITTKQFTPELLLKLTEKYHVTIVLAVGYQLATVVRSEMKNKVVLTSLKYFIAGGTKIWPDDVLALNECLPNGRVTQFYSLTEFGTVALNIKNPNPNSVGLLRNGVQCKIIDDNGQRVGVSVDGEIRIKGPTKLLTCSSDQNLCDAEGFLQTGDIGHFDQHGNLYVVDRSKDIFKCYDEYIYPSEIESIIKANPAVEDACIVGVSDKVASDLTTAIVVKKPDSKITEQDIKDLVKKNLPKGKQLFGGVYFISVMPQTLTGKVIRKEVQSIAIELYNKNAQA